MTTKMRVYTREMAWKKKLLLLLLLPLTERQLWTRSDSRRWLWPEKTVDWNSAQMKRVCALPVCCSSGMMGVAAELVA
jgi:hypothetical protein